MNENTENTEHVYTTDPYSEATEDAYITHAALNGIVITEYGRILNTRDYAMGCNLHDVARSIAKCTAATMGADEVTVWVESEIDGSCQGIGTAYGWERTDWSYRNFCDDNGAVIRPKPGTATWVHLGP